MRYSAISIILFCVVVLFLLSVNYVVWVTKADMSPVMSTASENSNSAAALKSYVSTFKVLSLHEFAEITDRPVFLPTRRLPPKPKLVTLPSIAKPKLPAKPKFVPRPIPQFSARAIRLVGVSMDGSYKRALISTPQDTIGVWVSEGKNFKRWRIVKIASDYVILKAANGKEEQVYLYKALKLIYDRTRK